MQKLSLLALLLGLTFCFGASAADFQALDPTEAQSSPEIQALIQFGLQAIVKNGVQKQFFTNTNFTLAKINSIAEEVGSGNNYKFDIDFENSDKVQIKAKFEIHVDLSADNETLVSFAYNVYYPSVSVTGSDDNTEETEADTEAEEAQAEGEGTIKEAEHEEEAETEEVVEESEGEVEPNSEEEESNTEEESNETEEEEGGDITVTIPSDNSTNSTNSTGLNEFVDITRDEFHNSTELNNIFQFGFATVVNNGIKDNSIPNTNFTFAVITALAKKDVPNGELYKFSARAVDNKSVEMNVTFQVLQEVQAYTYNVRVVANDTNSTETNTTAPIDTNTTTPDNGNGNNSTNTTTPSGPSDGGNTNSTNNNTEPAQQDPEVQKALDYGVQEVLASGKRKGKVPEGNYSITEVVNSTSQSVKKGVQYSFFVKLSNSNNTAFVETNFTVSYTNSTQQLALYSYSLKVTTIGPKPSHNNNSTSTNTTAPTNTTTPANPPDNTTAPANNTNTNTTAPANPDNTTLPSNNTDNTNSTTPIDNTLTQSNSTDNTTAPANPPDNITAPANNTNTNTTAPANPPDNTTAPASNTNTNTTVPANNSTNTTDYVPVDNATIAQDPVIQSVVKFGTDAIVKQGIQSKRIPDSVYNITQIVSVSQKTMKNGVSYKCNILLQNADKVKVNTTFTILDNSKTQNMTMTGYSYKVTNIPLN